MEKFLEGSQAAAEAAALCDPSLTVAYPITPQTHIVEDIAKLIADGKLKASHIEVESEFSAISAVIGGSAAGVRVYTATSSQGLALMHEALFAAAGMRFPIVMHVANRALSAPLSIWNDWQDSISERDSGWIQLFCETAEEVVDTTIQAYRIAEDKKVLLPIMVCMDGFFITHTMEPVDMPEKAEVDRFLPKYVPNYTILDPKKPASIGCFTFPKQYAEIRSMLSDAIDNSKDIIKEAHDDYAKIFKRKYGNGLVEEYRLEGKKIAIITMGSLAGNVREVVDSRKDVGLLRIRSFRPFPKEDIISALKDVNTVLIFEKDISLGTGYGALYPEIKSALGDKKKVINYIVGMGGIDCTVDAIDDAVEKSKYRKDGEAVWLFETQNT